MEKQPELFGEFKDTETKNRFFQKTLPEKSFTFTITQERLILISLGFIVVLAIVFVFGFERGRKGTKPHPLAKPIKMTKKAVLQEDRVQKNTAQVQVEEKPYTIQVATFKSKEYAQEEAAKLKKKGLSTTVIGINGLYRVWVGEYSSSKEAQQAVNTLIKTYKDCYIRKR